jgi:hypothetical protein
MTSRPRAPPVLRIFAGVVWPPPAAVLAGLRDEGATGAIGAAAATAAGGGGAGAAGLLPPNPAKVRFSRRVGVYMLRPFVRGNIAAGRV